MHITEEIINGETYQIITMDNGSVIRQLKMTEAQIAAMASKKRRIMSKLEFKRQFSMGELVAFKTAAKSDATMEVFDDLLNISEEINLDDPLIAQGMDYLVTKEIITQEKMDLIIEGV